MAVETILDGLNPAQREAVEATEGPVLVIAGAGSGKTRVITHRVALLIDKKVHPRNILSITFTNKAAAEMRERIETLVGRGVASGMWIMTFHACCARMLRHDPEAAEIGRNFTIYDDSDSVRVVSRALKDLEIDPRRFTPRQVRNVISSAKNACVTARNYSEVASGYLERTVADVYLSYERTLKQNNALDFDDLLMKTVQMLERNIEARQRWQRRFQYVVVDEYQDTNHVQYRMVSLLSEPENNLCVVGDEDQSVYAFRGATIRNILEFERDYPSARVIKLERNYRSTQTVLDAANAVIANNLSRKEKSLFTELGQGDRITRYQAIDEHDEASWVAGEINRLLRETARGVEIAVFYRTNSQSRVLEEAFFKSGIGYRVVGGLRFWERKEIKDALAWLRAAMNPSDRISVLRALGSPKRGVGEGSMAKLEIFAATRALNLVEAAAQADAITSLTGKARNGLMEFSRLINLIQKRNEDLDVRLSDVVRTAFDDSGMIDELKASDLPTDESKIENLLELAGVADEFATRPDSGEGRLEEFLERAALIAETDVLIDPAETVTLMTLHNAKGLEFGYVFVTGMEEGVFPHSRSLDDPQELEEERRLAYVGITRAMRKLYVSHAWSRSLWGGANYNPVSRFISEIPEELMEVTGHEKVKPRDRGFDWGSSSPSGGFGAGRGFQPRQKSRNADGDTTVVAVKIGDKVMHEAFGVGEVIEISGAGSDAEITVNFEDEGARRLMAAYANLSKA